MSSSLARQGKMQMAVRSGNFLENLKRNNVFSLLTNRNTWKELKYLHSGRLGVLYRFRLCKRFQT